MVRSGGASTLSCVVAVIGVVVLVRGTAASETSDEPLGRFVAQHSTRTVTSLSTITVTGLSTCLSVASTPCVGRRKRSLHSIIQKVDTLDENIRLALDGSQLDDTDAVETKGDNEKKAQKDQGKLLTVWSTQFTTVTLTSTSLLASTTVTASALCSVSGLNAGCF